MAEATDAFSEGGFDSKEKLVELLSPNAEVMGARCSVVGSLTFAGSIFDEDIDLV